MNAWSLYNVLQQRLPGYTLTEYLEVLNEAYQDLWTQTDLLNVDYFSDIATVTVAVQGKEFDLRYNLGNGLSAPVHPKIFQISRIRVLQPGAASWVSANPREWTDTARQAQEQDATSPVSTTAPYYYKLFGRGLIRFARPLPVGTQLEIVYTIGFFDLSIVTVGTVASSGTTVTGTGTKFTQLLPPDFDVGYLPGPDDEADIEAELVVGAALNPSTPPLIYHVSAVASDTSLSLLTAPNPALAGSTYAVGSIPDTPESHHRLIVDMALRAMLARPAIATDTRFQYWNTKVERALAVYADHLIERQHQEADKRQRFPYGAMRRGEQSEVR